jgi:hypothetical protein
MVNLMVGSWYHQLHSIQVSTTPFLMLCPKGSISNSHPDDDITVQGYNSNLRQALQVIARARENYAEAYEALDGMRNKNWISGYA